MGTPVSQTDTASARRPTAPLDGQALLTLVLGSLDQDSAQEIVDIDLAGKSDMADHMVVASGRSSRHVAAIAEKLLVRLKHDGGVRAKVEGREAADWVLIDAGDVIVHLFRPEVRAYYQIEKMWQPQPEPMARRA
ncbi:MAG: ribosome silencing factor [Pseudomonadota bacterium]